MNAVSSDRATAPSAPLFWAAESSVAPQSTAPMLLVSVRDSTEASEALSAGCPLIDVKDPARGALGFAGIPRVSEIVASARGPMAARGATLSVALGELAEWRDRASPSLPLEITFAKLGLAGLRRAPDWRREWRDARDRFDAARSDALPANGALSSVRPLSWIAVAYADAEAASAPEPEEVLDAAVESGCAGLLIDTWDKRAGTVFDILEASRLRALLASARRAELMTALAGRLRLDQIPRAVSLRPTIVAVRSAACRGSDRAASIDAGAVRDLLLRLRTAGGIPTEARHDVE